ncbi:MAG: type II secretion system GspH family protein [Nitrospirota bacterium]|nr:type II secretion system GspH family protein [Nitrospirota bacterium]
MAYPTGNGRPGRLPWISYLKFHTSDFCLDNRGFTFVALAVIIFIMGISLLAVRPTWTVIMKIEKEQELLYVGKAFKDAIKRYHDAGPPNNKTLPARLEDLLSDPRSPSAKKYLRKIYRDPMTGEDDWVVVMDGAQRIRGIHSRSEEEPFKQDHFPDEFQQFANKKKYSEWVFEYNPVPAGTTTGQGQSTATGNLTTQTSPSSQ